MGMHPNCYGAMFPPMASLSTNRAVAGTVFRYRIDQPGPIPTEQSLGVDMEAWERCTQCPDFDACYRLSAGTVLMDLALRT